MEFVSSRTKFVVAVSLGVTAREEGVLRSGTCRAAIWLVSLAASDKVKGGSWLGPAEVPSLMSVHGDDLWIMARVSILAVSSDDMLLRLTLCVWIRRLEEIFLKQQVFRLTGPQPRRQLFG